MRTWATGTKAVAVRAPAWLALRNTPRSALGFTLIEILVVVVILGVLVAALTLSVGGGSERQFARQAEQARSLIAYACEQAELTGREIGLSLSLKGYRFSWLERDVWLAIPSGELHPRVWLAGTGTALSRDERNVEIVAQYPEKPQLLCFSSGELTPFRLDLGLADLKRRYRLDGQSDGTVELVVVADRAR
jgi:general secretion pathway protein H